jgi:hypothetical protein
MQEALKIVAPLLFVAVFGYQLWHMYHTRNWGKFDKTSMLVWGSLLLVIALVAVGLVVLLRSAAHV